MRRAFLFLGLLLAFALPVRADYVPDWSFSTGAPILSSP
jgi:hypothetical protein